MGSVERKRLRARRIHACNACYYCKYVEKFNCPKDGRLGDSMKNPFTSNLSRRAALRTGAVGLAALAMPEIGKAQTSTIIVRVYQGYFRTVFTDTILPKFTSTTGIAVKTVADTTSAVWLVELEKAARIGVAAADVSMMSRATMLQGIKTKLWAPVDLSGVPYSKYLIPQYLARYADGQVAAVGASAWTTVDDTAYWAVSRASRATAQNQAFIDFMCRPTVQAQLIEALGIDPTVNA